FRIRVSCRISHLEEKEKTLEIKGFRGHHRQFSTHSVGRRATKECDELQKFSRQLGMSWRIFCVDDFFSTHFTCLKPGERFLAKDSDFYDIGEDCEEVRDYMRYCSTRKALIGGQS
ncbi:MAG: hypothetical protein ABSH35_19165, partial [Isosphaeraceae bacterium]